MKIEKRRSHLWSVAFLFVRIIDFTFDLVETR